MDGTKTLVAVCWMRYYTGCCWAMRKERLLEKRIDDDYWKGRFDITGEGFATPTLRPNKSLRASLLDVEQANSKEREKRREEIKKVAATAATITERVPSRSRPPFRRSATTGFLSRTAGQNLSQSLMHNRSGLCSLSLSYPFPSSSSVSFSLPFHDET